MEKGVTFEDVAGAADGAGQEELIRALVGRMSLKEKLGQMTGDTGLAAMALMLVRYGWRTYDSGRNDRLGIPPLRFTDGPRGVTLGRSTCFPVAMARGASWDPGLEERVGRAMGLEAKARGAGFFGGICINLLRHPGWGRAQETYGEDSHLLGEMGTAALRGVGENVIGCVKHFACNSMERSRFFVDVRVSERTLREVYLPHFKRCVDAGAMAVMSAYNRVNGEYCGENHHLLRDILKEEWGFEGLVVSDWVWGVRDGAAGVRAGLDMEMPRQWRFGRPLRRAVERGEVDEALVDEAVARVLRVKARYVREQAGGANADAGPGPEVAACREHVELAREAARKGMVLLKNEGGALPLETGSGCGYGSGRLGSIAVIGRLAGRANLGDHGSSRVRPPYAVSPLDGIRARAGEDVRVVYEDGCNLAGARRAAREADAVVLVAGFDYSDEGEMFSSLSRVGGDRTCLGLRPSEADLIKAVAGETGRLVVVLEGGSAITVQDWIDGAEAVVMAWYPGMEGGNALADLLFGDCDFSGRLPVTFPASDGQLPAFDNEAREMEYGYLHGYRLFDRDSLEPAFHFGFGLSYTAYEYRHIGLDREEVEEGGTVTVTVKVANVGKRAGEGTVQLYVGCPGEQVERPLKELKGFKKMYLEPAAEAGAVFDVALSDLAFYDVESSSWVVEKGEYLLLAGSSSRDEDLPLRASFRVT